MKQQLTSLREHFLGGQKDTHLPKNSPNMDSIFLSHRLEHTIQNGMVNNNYDIDKNLDFIINLLKDRISLLERQLVERNSIIDFLVKHQMSPVLSYSKLWQ